MNRPIRHTSGRRTALALAILAACCALAVIAPAAVATTRGAKPHTANSRTHQRLAPQAAVRGDVGRATRGCVVRLVRAAFVPATVAEGGTTHLRIALHNCTNSAKPVRVQTDGRLVCLTLDPLVRSFTVPAGKTLRIPQTYVAPSCAGTATIYVQVENRAGHQLANGQASFTVTAPST